MQNAARSPGLAWLLLALLLVLGAAVYLAAPAVTHTGTDIYYSYLEGQRIAAGVNPYTRILGGNMRENQKYPTYFPLFFLIAALMQRMGLAEFPAWFAALHWLLLPFNLGAGALLYYMLYRRKGVLLAVLGALIWFLNRWNLLIVRVDNIDNVAIFCLLLSLWLLDKQRLASLLLLGLSLAFKHFGLFIVPLYLIVIWQDTRPAGARAAIRATLGGALAVATIPCLVSIPFLFWPGDTVAHNAEGFARSIFFSATRDAAAHVDAPSLDSTFGLSGFTARLPMFGLFTLIYAVYWQARLKLYAACFLVIAALIDFNPVLFTQYFCWLVPFGLLAAAEMDVVRRRVAQPARSRAPAAAPAIQGRVVGHD